MLNNSRIFEMTKPRQDFASTHELIQRALTRLDKIIAHTAGREERDDVRAAAALVREARDIYTGNRPYEACVERRWKLRQAKMATYCLKDLYGETTLDAFYDDLAAAHELLRDAYGVLSDYH